MVDFWTTIGVTLYSKAYTMHIAVFISSEWNGDPSSFKSTLETVPIITIVLNIQYGCVQMEFLFVHTT